MEVLSTMAAIANIGAVADAAEKILKVNPDDVNTLTRMYGKARSISEAASKYVMEYPVAISDGVIDLKYCVAITKQVELDCARFMLLASNLNPVIDTNSSNDSISAHIGALSGEALKNMNKPGIKVTISPATYDDIARGQEYMNEVYSDEEYIPFKRSSFLSQEMVDDDGSDQSATILSTSDPDHDELVKLQEENKLLKGSIDKIKGSSFNNALADLTKVNKMGPTIVNINLILKGVNGSNNTISVPIAVKASLQYINNSDVENILKGVQSKATKIHNILKITTGQANFFKDWLLELEAAKKDANREHNLGQFPFFRQLMNAKSKYRMKSIFEGIPVIKNFIAKKTQKDMPMCTLVVTEEDITNVTGFRLNQILQKPTFVKEAIDVYMLLGFGIIDQVNNLLYLFYAGEDKPSVADITKIGKSDNGNSNTELIKALAKIAMRR